MDAFVTCIYNDLNQTKFGGRLGRSSRYLESIIKIANTGIPIFCYTSSKEFKELQSNLSAYSNIKLIQKDLHSFDMSDKVQTIKDTFKEKYSDLFWKERCTEIMWGKFFMINETLNNFPQIKNIYWIDSGLFHNDAIAPKYFTNLELFNPRLITKLTAYLNDKLLLIQHVNPHNKPIDSKYNINQYQNDFGAVGGFFGGCSKKMRMLCKEFMNKSNKLLVDNELCSEEGILSAIYADHPELFKTYVFESWYHDGWGDRHNPTLSTFSDVFDEILQ